jgi:hypothetical protein
MAAAAVVLPAPMAQARPAAVVTIAFPAAAVVAQMG